MVGHLRYAFVSVTTGAGTFYECHQRNYHSERAAQPYVQRIVVEERSRASDCYLRILERSVHTWCSDQPGQPQRLCEQNIYALSERTPNHVRHDVEMVQLQGEIFSRRADVVSMTQSFSNTRETNCTYSNGSMVASAPIVAAQVLASRAGLPVYVPHLHIKSSSVLA
jgi:hypothetical protein